MNINKWAESILSGHDLRDKILNAPNLRNDKRGPSQKEFRTPARSKEIQFNEKRHPFPNESQLESDHGHAVALHHFANHELLAIEIMALMLLRFQNAPTSFRGGLVKTIHEEQRHLSMYVKRMKDFGYEFGDFPLNGFFWNAAQEIQSIDQYNALMGLTFEQANLDFAIHYRNLFTRMKDTKTASIMDQVLKDEIGHVQFALHWFQKDCNDLWAKYLKNLIPPMSPTRAKGKHFHIDLRKKIGFPSKYIEELQLYSKSKGRAPDLYFFNPGVESELHHQSSLYTSQWLKDFKHDLEDTLFFLSRRDDIVLLEERPSQDFLKNTQAILGYLPEVLVGDLNSPEVQERLLRNICPWGWTPQLLQTSKTLHLSNAAVIPINERALTKSHSKCNAISVLHRLVDELPHDLFPNTFECGHVVSSYGECMRSIENLRQNGHETLILKSPYGTSAGNTLLIEKKDDLNEKWIENILNKHSEIIVEPWLNRINDLSIQIYVDKKIRYLGISQFLTNARGVYQGAIVSPPLKGISKDVISYFLKSKEKDSMVSRIAQFVGGELYKLGYRGPAGIDGYIYKNNSNEIRYKPISEINSRFNFGNINLKLRSLISPGSHATWRIEKKSQKPISKFEVHNGLIRSGLIPTNDFNKATKFMSFLEVTRSQDI